MSLITEKMKIQNVATRWESTYGTGKYGVDKLDILKKLEALDVEKATTEDIKNIIGNDDWTRIECTECGNDVDAAIVFDGYEEDSIVCKSCLLDAITMIDGGN